MTGSTIARKMMLGMTLVVLISVLATVAMNSLLLEPYYYRAQEKKLEEAAAGVREIWEDPLTEDRSALLDEISYRISGPVLIWQEPSGEILYSSHNLSRPGGMMGHMNRMAMGMPAGKGWESAQGVLVHQESLPEGQQLLLQTSVQSIEASIGIFNRFSVFPAAAALLASLLVAAFYARGFSRPIVALSRMTGKMRDLDFSLRYQGDSRDEIGQLGQDFNLLADRLEETIGDLQREIEEKQKMEKARLEFMAGASHELKTPLALIRGYTEGLLDGVADSGREEEYLRVILDESEKMTRMVGELLDISRLEKGSAAFRRDRLDYGELVRKNLERFRMEFEHRGIVPGAEISPELTDISGDRELLGRALTNLLSNALDHVDDAGEIRIRVFREGDFVVTRVENSGSPIPESRLESIWEPFVKEDPARKRAYGGTGLGLTIVRDVIRAHGGTWEAENIPGGVSFRFSLPIE